MSALLQHDTNNSKLLLLSAVFTTATTVAVILGIEQRCNEIVTSREKHAEHAEDVFALSLMLETFHICVCRKDIYSESECM
jgi:hypothetical protein